MSIKSFIQVFILLLIILIISSVYLKYFDTKKNVAEEIEKTKLDNVSEISELEKKIFDLELENKNLNEKIENNNKLINTDVQIVEKNVAENSVLNSTKDDSTKSKENVNKETIFVKKEIKNLVKDVKYTSVDQKGNKFNLLASSAKTGDNKEILELINVRGKINSEKRDTIFIVSDFALYNTSNLNSKFYQNVIINYQDKEISCKNFDINMETNKAIAYNNVIITDPKSIMNAGIVEFDLKTKDVNINPSSTTTEVEVIKK
tara:strand:+ start:176 stop:958 length:783 start_codon:yes stop_codon:yes gene_type:complete